jgi:hypothetical protein
MKKLLFIFSLLTLFGCGSNYEYWDISHFNMDPNALSDKEEIAVLYTSRAPDYQNDLEHFIHFVVVSRRTGDTVNVLSISNNYLKKGDSKKVFHYFGPDNPMSKIDLMRNQGITVQNVNDIATDKLYAIKHVLRDPSFDFIANNTHPTVIGTIGEMLPNNEEPMQTLPSHLQGDTNMMNNVKKIQP